MAQIYFDSTDLANYGVFFDESKTFVKPPKRMQTIQIPGRNGLLMVSDGCFDNVLVEYPCFIRSDFVDRFDELINFLNSKDADYRVIETSTDISVYRRGVFHAAIEPSTGAFNQYGQFTLEFDCKPQVWLKSGDIASSYTASGTIVNPTSYTAQPLLRVYGTGTFTIGNTSVTISAANTYTDINCELMDCYKGTKSRNAYVTFSGNDFPTLPSGTSTVTLGSGITRIDITPHWWKL